MKVKIYDNKFKNYVIIYLPTEIRNKIIGVNVVVKEVGEELWIREALPMDEDVLKINASNGICYTPKNVEKPLGEFDYEIENDFIVLYRS